MALLGCGGNGDTDASSASTGGTAALYEADRVYDDVKVVDLTLHDAARDRDVNIRIRASMSAPQPMPMVLLSYGGTKKNQTVASLFGAGRGACG